MWLYIIYYYKQAGIIKILLKNNVYVFTQEKSFIEH